MCSALLKTAVVTYHIGGVNVEQYDEMLKNVPKGDSGFVAKMRRAQGKSQGKHKASAKKLVMSLFEDTPDEP